MSRSTFETVVPAMSGKDATNRLLPLLEATPGICNITVADEEQNEHGEVIMVTVDYDLVDPAFKGTIWVDGLPESNLRYRSTSQSP